MIVYDINENWPMDLAFVDKLAKYNREIKYLMVAADVWSSRYERVEPLKSKDAKETAPALKKMIRKKQLEDLERQGHRVQRRLQKIV